QADELLKEQALSNYLQAKEYRQAITLALSLDKPHRLYTIFSDLLNARLSAGRNSGDGEADNTRLACGEDTGVLGSEEVDKVVQSLAQDQLARLLGYVRSWNTNAKLCHVSQTVLYCILSSYSPDSLLEIPEAKSIISALLSYSERHFNRMDRLLTDSYIIDYTLCAMDSLNLTDGVQGEAWQEEEDEADAMQ
ncbi:U3 small nucleolar RNA-associated protein, partial [Spiromyces aspiralis]